MRTLAHAAILGAALIAHAGRAGAVAVTMPAPQLTASALAYDQALLGQFNLITLGRLDAGNETEGRVVVGGDFNRVGGSANVCFLNCSGNSGLLGAGSGAGGIVAPGAGAAPYGALTVFGNVTGSNTTVNAIAGDVRVQGSVSGTIELNHKGGFYTAGSGAGSRVSDATVVATSRSAYAGAVQNLTGTPQTSQADAFPFGATAQAGFASPLTDLANGIAALHGTQGAQTLAASHDQNRNNNVTFTATRAFTGANGAGYGVVNTTLSDLAAFQNLRFVNGDNAATFVIVAVDNGALALPQLNAYAESSKIIFDFVTPGTYAAYTGHLTFNTFYGSILAPLASLSQTGDLNGSVVAGRLVQSQEVHDADLFAGDLSGLAPPVSVPEPWSLALLAGGVGVAGLIAARRR